MKLSKLYLLLVLPVLIIGCVPSLNPVYTDEDLIFEPAMLGLWNQEGSEVTWNFRKRGEKGYQLIFTDDDGQIGRFIAKLADIDGTQFLDLYPEEIAIDANAFYRFHLVPMHTVYLVKSIKSDLVLSAIDGKWLDQYLDNNPDAVQFATFRNRKLITAGTAELQEFITAHKDAFTVDFSLKRDTSGVN